MCLIHINYLFSWFQIERLAQYERLAGSGEAGARRRGQRLSDLERVQDLFPNDFLALHEHDVVAATAGTLVSSIWI